MKCRCFPLTALFILLLACSSADEEDSHALVKRQIRPGFPLSRSRQFPAPEELEDSDEYVSSEEEEPQVPRFRGRQPQPIDDEYENTYTEAPKTTTPTAPKPTSRTAAFNSRLAARPRFGQQPSTSSSTSKAPESAARTPAQSQRLDVVASILNRPPPQRPSSRSVSSSKPINEITKKPARDAEPASRRAAAAPQRTRTRGRQRAKSTTTTTTTTTTEPPQTEEYYYYYEDEADDVTIATTTSTTTTTTTTRRPFTKRPAGNSRSRSTARPAVRFDPDSIQFAPPPDNPLNVVKPSSSTTKRYTTSTTLSPEDGGAIPPHLRSRYRARSDGRFIDFLRDPNRPRELKGFDLTDYPFYVTVPEDITFDCDDKKDGYYASVPHQCQLFHYCFAGARYDFLCANYTLYDQTTFTCRFANNVDCASSEKFYNRNDDLWKETTTTTTTTPAPETRRRRKPKPRDYEYDEDDYDYDEEEERRRNRRRRNRMKNKKKQSEEEEEK